MEHESTWPFVRTAVVDDVVPSTSDLARALILDSAPVLPLLVWARCQSRGRGRGTRQWWSDRGSLTFTLAIDPQVHGLSPVHEPRLALGTSVAIIEALGDLELAVPAIGIRWPNDLEAEGRKLGGILPERVEVEQGRRLLVGIGINVCSDLADAPSDVRAMAVSLSELAGVTLREAILSDLLAAILKRFDGMLVRLAHDEPSLAAEWARLDQLRDRWVTVDLGTSIVAGWGGGIEGDGSLCVDADGRRTHLVGGQVLRY
jgi:BirA family transcriptional regulator, biotin operon repressor / biotin---[acetyl-CoA-carboxylase] ligase